MFAKLFFRLLFEVGVDNVGLSGSAAHGSSALTRVGFWVSRKMSGTPIETVR